MFLGPNFDDFSSASVFLPTAHIRLISENRHTEQKLSKFGPHFLPGFNQWHYKEGLEPKNNNLFYPSVVGVGGPKSAENCIF